MLKTVIIIKLNLIYFAVYYAVLVNKKKKTKKKDLENSFLLCSLQVPSALPHRLSF